VHLDESMARALTFAVVFASATKPLPYLDPQLALREEAAC
jgi:hypothetical protein